MKKLRFLSILGLAVLLLSLSVTAVTLGQAAECPEREVIVFRGSPALQQLPAEKLPPEDKWIDGSTYDGRSVGECGLEIYGNDYDNTIFGSEGDDIIYGYGGNDQITGGPGNDTIDGGSDTYPSSMGDIFDEHDTSDRMFVDLGLGISASENLGVDVLTGIETVVTGSGDDVLIGYRDHIRCQLMGNVGNDILVSPGTQWNVLIGDEGDDILIGGAGIHDQFTETQLDNVEVHLGAPGFAIGDRIGRDILWGIEDINTGGGDDILVGDEHNNVIVSHGGKDTLVGGAGRDAIYGGDDNDILCQNQYDSGTKQCIRQLDSAGDYLDGGEGEEDTCWLDDNVPGIRDTSKNCEIP